MNKSVVNELKDNKGNPSISIVVSTKLRSFSDQEKIQLKLKNCIKEVTSKLEGNYDEVLTKKLINSIKVLSEQFQPEHYRKAIGIYVSPGFSKLISFPIDVDDKVHIGHDFEVTEIEESIRMTVDFNVLLLNRDSCRLFIGQGNEIREIHDENFPLKYEDQFQVERASTHSLYNDEESKIDKVRIENYFRKVDKHLALYELESPLVLLGVAENTNLYKNISKFKNLIIGEKAIDFDKSSLSEISKIVVPLIEWNMELG